MQLFKSLLWLALPACLTAQEVQWGCQISAIRPLQDLADPEWMGTSIKPGGGLHALVDLDGGMALVPRLDYYYSSNATANLKTRADITTLGFDVNIFTGDHVGEGLYFLVGGAYCRTHFHQQVSGVQLDEWEQKAYLATGAGWQLDPHISLELRYSGTSAMNLETYSTSRKAFVRAFPVTQMLSLTLMLRL